MVGINIVNYVGFVAGALQITCKIPQIIKILKTKDTKAISLVMYLGMTTSFILWLIYGIIVKDSPILITALINFFLVGSILVLKLRGYRKDI